MVLKNINWKLYGAFIITGLSHTLYTTLRVYFLNDLPTDQGINIASQIQWLGLIYEVVQEAMILPLFYLIGQTMSNNSLFASRIKTSLLLIFFIYTGLSFLIVLNIHSLLEFMNSFSLESVFYIKLETIAFIFLTLNQAIMIILSLLNENKGIYALLVLQTILTIFCDIFFLSNYSFSLKLGVNGIAFSNIISYGFTSFLGLILINKFTPISQARLDFSWLKDWGKIGSSSGMESLVRNLAYFYMIIYMMNTLSQQGVYWQATSFIWVWLLLPILKLSELIKRDTGISRDLFKQNYSAYLLLTTIIIGIWLLCIPFYKSFIVNMFNVENPQEILYLLSLLIPCYIVFAFGQIWTGYLYGIGRTDMLLYGSMFVNLVYYSTFYFLYIKGIFIPSLDSISYMFGGGLILASVVTYLQFKFVLLKENRDS